MNNRGRYKCDDSQCDEAQCPVIGHNGEGHNDVLGELWEVAQREKGMFNTA